MIEPGMIPQYTGDWAQLEKDIAALRKKAGGIRGAGGDVHSRFQGVSAHYKAPEAGQLLSSTLPVKTTADEFADDIEALAKALETFVSEAKPHADRLKQLKQKAFTFVDGVEGDDDWTDDQEKVDTHQALMDGVAAAREGFQEAERKAANTINAISPAMCRPKWVEDDGSHQPGMYGQSAEMLKGVEDLPWGSPEGRTYERWSLEWWGHGAKSWVWDGIVVDSIWGGVEGIGTLLGYDGAEAAGQAWDGLRRTFVGTYAYGMDWAGQEEHLSDWQQESKGYAKEFGKAFIAYDMWEEDPARAHATVFFNIITLGAGPLGAAAKLGKGGTFTKAAGTMAKIGDALDPLSGGLRAAKALSDLPRVSQVLANVSNNLNLPKTDFPETAPSTTSTTATGSTRTATSSPSTGTARPTRIRPRGRPPRRTGSRTCPSTGRPEQTGRTAGRAGRASGNWSAPAPAPARARPARARAYHRRGRAMNRPGRWAATGAARATPRTWAQAAPVAQARAATATVRRAARVALGPGTARAPEAATRATAGHHPEAAHRRPRTGTPRATATVRLRKAGRHRRMAALRQTGPAQGMAHRTERHRLEMPAAPMPCKTSTPAVTAEWTTTSPRSSQVR
ncbi:hypothetical protein [Streptomyces xinghaiensis]|uniref:hypothetical protein n=1 Tax=Streptomyces xinghaiensis TaxID=1038928 RepID=UPI002E0F606A|nr:hypothetical protein OG463_12755 [Streptomyces xinghaiensis]